MASPRMRFQYFGKHRESFANILGYSYKPSVRRTPRGLSGYLPRHLFAKSTGAHQPGGERRWFRRFQ